MARATLSMFEIPAGDPGRLADFFRRVFAWEVDEVPWDGPRHLLLRLPAPARPVGGGVLARDSGGSALVDRLTVTIRIEGETLEQTLQRVEAEGGRTELAPTSIGGRGRYARFLDPEGNGFGLWSDAAGG